MCLWFIFCSLHLISSQNVSKSLYICRNPFRKRNSTLRTAETEYKVSVMLESIILISGRRRFWKRQIDFVWHMTMGFLWLFQLCMSGWVTGRYSLRCQPVDYSNHPETMRVNSHFTSECCFEHIYITATENRNFAWRTEAKLCIRSRCKYIFQNFLVNIIFSPFVYGSCLFFIWIFTCE